MANIPESTFDDNRLQKFLSSIKENLHNFEVTTISYIPAGNKTKTPETFSQLFEELKKLDPLDRTHLKVDFKFTKNQNTGRFSTGSFNLGIAQTD